jgi:hypothetical protein
MDIYCLPQWELLLAISYIRRGSGVSNLTAVSATCYSPKDLLLNFGEAHIKSCDGLRRFVGV